MLRPSVTGICWWIITYCSHQSSSHATGDWSQEAYQHSLNEVDCPSATEKWLPVNMVPWGEAGRALLTLPVGVVEVGASPMAGAGLGVMAATFIPRYTWLAEYEGEIVRSEYQNSNYAWVVWRGGEEDYLVDGGDIRTSSWLRWINMSRHVREENVMALQCMGRVYYVTTRDVTPGQELLVNYGPDYGEELNIDAQDYYDLSIDPSVYGQCWNV